MATYTGGASSQKHSYASNGLLLLSTLGALIGAAAFL